MFLHIPCEAAVVCARAWGGMSVEFNCGWMDSSEETRDTAHEKHSIGFDWLLCAHGNWPTGLKLKRSGSSRPLGRRVLGWRSSSKKACAQASSGERRVTGVYSSSREHRAMASGGVRGLNTWSQWRTHARTHARDEHRKLQLTFDFRQGHEDIFLLLLCLTRVKINASQFRILRVTQTQIYLCPRVSFNLWEFELCVVGVHLSDLLPCRSSKNLTQEDS